MLIGELALKMDASRRPHVNSLVALPCYIAVVETKLNLHLSDSSTPLLNKLGQRHPLRVFWNPELITGPSRPLALVTEQTPPIPPRLTRPPIRVAPKGRKMPTSLKRKRRPIPLFDDSWFCDAQNSYESLMPDLAYGSLICKQTHPAPNINSVDLNFGEEFNHTIHGPELNECLSISHLILVQQSTLKSLIQKILAHLQQEECHCLCQGLQA